MEDVTARDERSGFENAQVDLAALPDVADVDLEPVIPAYTRYSVLVHAAFGLAVTLAVGVFFWLVVAPGWGAAAAAAALLVVGVPLTVYGLLDARRFGWALRDHDVLTQKGVWWRKATALPLVRIQHVELASGPIERGFGTRRLQVFSAASGSADLTIYGLTPERAQRVREHLLRWVADDPDGHDDA